MANARVPPQHRAPLKALADIDEARFDALKRALHDAGPSTYQTPAELREVVGSVLTNATDRDNVIDLLFMIASIGQGQGTDRGNRFAEDLARSNDLELGAAERERLAPRLIELVHLPTVATSAKAPFLAQQHERLFVGSRIFTDIRPVFTENPGEPPAGAVLVNVLQIGFFKNGEYDEIYIGLDNEDLEVLSHTVARAVDKTNGLKAFLDGVGFARFDIPTSE